MSDRAEFSRFAADVTHSQLFAVLPRDERDGLTSKLSRARSMSELSDKDAALARLCVNLEGD